MYEKMDSASDVAEILWPEQLHSPEQKVSDVSGLAACKLWQRLYDEGKLTKVSIEMLGDWMQAGYELLEKDIKEFAEIGVSYLKDFDPDLRILD